MGFTTGVLVGFTGAMLGFVLSHIVNKPAPLDLTDEVTK